MHRIIVTDLDKTLLKINLEKEFLIYNFKQLKLQFNIFYHFMNKFFHKIQGKSIDFRFFYNGLSINSLDKLISKFFINNENKIIFNKKVLKACNKCKIIIIVSACSKPLVSNFIDIYFPDKYVINLSTKLSLNKSKYTGYIDYKVIKQNKKKIVEYFFKKTGIKYTNVKAFGNYPEDLHFLKLFKEYKIVK